MLVAAEQAATASHPAANEERTAARSPILEYLPIQDEDIQQQRSGMVSGCCKSKAWRRNVPDTSLVGTGCHGWAPRRRVRGASLHPGPRGHPGGAVDSHRSIPETSF